MKAKSFNTQSGKLGNRNTELIPPNGISPSDQAPDQNNQITEERKRSIPGAKVWFWVGAAAIAAVVLWRVYFPG